MASNSRRIPRHIPGARAAGLAAALCVALTVAPDPPGGPCDWDDSLMTEFDVADRTGIAERIPGLARAPEVDGTGEVLINGRPAELALGPLHVRVMRCVRSDQLPVLGQLSEGPQSTAPQPIHGVIAIVNASGDQLLYTNVSLDGLVAN